MSSGYCNAGGVILSPACIISFPPSAAQNNKKWEKKVFYVSRNNLFW